MTSTFEVDGYFIGFPKPIDALTVNPLSAQDCGICFHNDWLPAIQGALTVLQRRETWKGDPADVQTCVEYARLLMLHLSDPCSTDYPDVSCCYDWEVEENRLGWSPCQIDTGGGPIDAAGWVGAGWSPVYFPSLSRFVLDIDIPVPSSSYVVDCTVRYNSLETIHFSCAQRSDHVGAIAYVGVTGPPGVGEEVSAIATNAGIGFLHLELATTLSAFTLMGVCVTIRNPAAECPS